MRDPVIATDGVSYERAAIEAYMRRFLAPTPLLSPVTTAVMPGLTLLPNKPARELIAHLGLIKEESA